MGHNHHHHHEHGINFETDSQTPYLIGMFANLFFVIFEIYMSYVSDSLALFADAIHNLSDVLALLLAWIGVIALKFKPNKKYTYGYHNVSILISLLNSILLLGSIIYIIIEAGRDLLSATDHANGTLIIIVALIGIFVNGITAYLFIGNKHDLNAKTAYLHMVADTAVSLGVVISAGIILLTGWHWIDPVCSIAIAIVLLLTAWPLFKQTLGLSVNGVPNGIDIDEIYAYLNNKDEILNVHDLHVWPLSTTETSFTVHLHIKDDVNQQKLLDELTDTLKTQFKLDHITIQVEFVDSEDCVACNKI